MRELESLRRHYGGHIPGLLGARHSYAVLCPLVERPEGLHLLRLRLDDFLVSQNGSPPR